MTDDVRNRTGCKNSGDKTFCPPLKGLFSLPFKGKGGEANIRVLRNGADEQLQYLMVQRKKLVEEFQSVFPRVGGRLPFRLYLHTKVGSHGKDYAYLFWYIRRSSQSLAAHLPKRVQRLIDPAVQDLVGTLPVSVRRTYLDFDLRAMKIECEISEATHTLRNMSTLVEAVEQWEQLYQRHVISGVEPAFALRRQRTSTV